MRSRVCQPPPTRTQGRRAVRDRAVPRTFGRRRARPAGAISATRRRLLGQADPLARQVPNPNGATGMPCSPSVSPRCRDEHGRSRPLPRRGGARRQYAIASRRLRGRRRRPATDRRHARSVERRTHRLPVRARGAAAARRRSRERPRLLSTRRGMSSPPHATPTGASPRTAPAPSATSPPTARPGKRIIASSPATRRRGPDHDEGQTLAMAQTGLAAAAIIK